MIVADVMSTKVVSLPPSTRYKEVWDAFIKKHHHAIPVVDKKNVVLGIVTEEDLLRPIYPDEKQMSDDFLSGTKFEEMEGNVKNFTKLTVDKVMNRRVIFTRPETPMLRALSRMIIRNVRQLPVVDVDRGLVGMVTKSDIVAALMKRQFKLSRGGRNTR